MGIRRPTHSFSKHLSQENRPVHYFRLGNESKGQWFIVWCKIQRQNFYANNRKSKTVLMTTVVILYENNVAWIVSKGFILPPKCLFIKPPDIDPHIQLGWVVGVVSRRIDDYERNSGSAEYTMYRTGAGYEPFSLTQRATIILALRFRESVLYIKWRSSVGNENDYWEPIQWKSADSSILLMFFSSHSNTIARVSRILSVRFSGNTEPHFFGLYNKASQH